MNEIRTEILVAGGGMAGVCCALAAARNGAEVILAQDRPVLGGNASSEIRMHIVGADCSGARGKALEVEAREGGIIEEIRLENAVNNPQRSASVFDLILYDKCRSEPTLTLMLNTSVTDCDVEGTIIKWATLENHSSEQRCRISADIFIDCTGDGGMGARAGAFYREGRESGSEFSESLAPMKSDSEKLGTTLMFQAKDHGVPMPFTPPPWARRFSEQDLKLRPHADVARGDDLGLDYGYWWAEWGGDLNTITDNEKIRDELLAIMMGIWDHIKNGGEHGAENWALEWIGFLPGKRESRRFTGQYTLTQNDILESRLFIDAIAYGGWPIDTHPAGGIDSVEIEPCNQLPVPELYDIPLSSCISGNIGNLMFAGRNISTTHIAFASTRVMATSAVIGQGVGTTAAFAINKHLQPSDLSSRKDIIHGIQQQLLRDNAFLIGVRNSNPEDLAGKASICASSFQSNGQPEYIISGWTRSVYGTGGVSRKRAAEGSQRWMSNPDEPLPQWIELMWNEPITIKAIEITFDTGMHRVLTLTQAEAYTRKMHWGRAQEETVRDYLIIYKSDGEWNKISKVRDNYLAQRVHKLKEEISTGAIRIVVQKTNGINHARILEVRVYSSYS